MLDFKYLNINEIENNKPSTEDWVTISEFVILPEWFIEKYNNKVSWSCISLKQNLSEEFIRKFQDKVDWYYISIHQTLSYDFIQEFQHKLIMELVKQYQESYKDNIKINSY